MSLLDDRRLALVCALIFAVGIIGMACAPEVEEEPDPTEPEEPEYDFDAGIVISRGEEAETLDIQNTTHASANTTWELLGDSLVIFDEEGNPSPLIAEDWDVSDDGLVYTFYIRDDVTFHSGKELTAHDVEASFERWLSVEGSPTRGDLGEVESLEATDDYTFEIRLEEPHNAIWNVLASPYGTILNVENIDEEGDDWGTARAELIDGTGPFMLADWRRDDQMVLERNEDYVWGPEALYENTGPANIKEITFRVIPEETTRAAEIRRGNIHIDTGVPSAEIPSIKEAEHLVTIMNRPPSLSFLGINCEAAPLDDVKIRKALAHAINREEIVEVVRDGMGDPPYSFLRPGTPGYCPHDPLCFEDEIIRYDVDQAIELLEEAGWTEVDDDGIRMKDGERLESTLSISDTETAVVQGELVQSYAREIGMDIELNTMELAALFEHLRAADHEMFTMGVGYGRRGPDTLYWYHHPGQRPAPNRFYLEHDEMTELLELSRVTPDEEERQEAFCRIEQILLEEVPWIYLTYRDYLAAHDEKLENPQLEHAMYTFPKLLEVKVLSE